VNPGPGGCVFGECAEIISAGVVHVPVHETRIATLLQEPVGERKAI
jgi:hypothetical protein